MVIFENTFTAPVKTGTDLLRLVESVLADIQFQLKDGDASSRPLLEKAENEDEVQKWLTEQLQLRARGRFSVYREPEVAKGDKPDIVVASTSAQCEVAIEVKHGGKNWSLRQLGNALCNQLAENYLKPTNRRHGVLVITHHGKRTWRDPETRQGMSFDQLIKQLADKALAICQNKNGAINVRCIGLNASIATARKAS